MYFSKIFLLFILIMPLSAQAASTYVWSGIDATNSSYSLYGGAYTALSGQDIYSEDGFLFRTSAGGGGFDYSSDSGDRTDVKAFGGDVMLGRSFFFKGGNLNLFSGYGLEHQDKSSSNPAENVYEKNHSLRVSADLYSRPFNNLSLLVLGSYSSHKEGYFSHLSVGYDFGSFEFGPTATVMGSTEFKIRRVGVSFGGLDLGFATAHLSGGLQINQDSDRSGYLGVGLGRSF